MEADDEGVLDSLRGALLKLRALSQLDERALALTEGLERALAETEEVSISLSRYSSAIDLNPEQLQTVQERLSLLADLRRKYGASVSEMLETLARLEAEFGSLGQIGERLNQVRAELTTAQTELRKLARKLSEKRSKNCWSPRRFRHWRIQRSQDGRSTISH